VVGGPVVPRNDARMAANAASGEVDKLAPISEPESALGPPSSIRVSWVAVFIPPEAAEGEKEEAK